MGGGYMDGWMVPDGWTCGWMDRGVDECMSG